MDYFRLFFFVFLHVNFKILNNDQVQKEHCHKRCGEQWQY